MQLHSMWRLTSCLLPGSRCLFFAQGTRGARSFDTRLQEDGRALSCSFLHYSPDLFQAPREEVIAAALLSPSNLPSLPLQHLSSSRGLLSTERTAFTAWGCRAANEQIRGRKKHGTTQKALVSRCDWLNLAGFGYTFTCTQGAKMMKL